MIKAEGKAALTKGFLLSWCIEATSTGVVQAAAARPARFLGLFLILHMLL